MQRINHLDPRLQQLLQQFGADEHVERIIKELKIGAANDKAIDLSKTTPHFRHDVVPFEHSRIVGEVFQVKNHVVYRLQIKPPVPPAASYFPAAFIKGLGDVTHKNWEVEIFHDSEGEPCPGSVWVVWIKDLKLNGLNRAFYERLVPQRWDAQLVGLR